MSYNKRPKRARPARPVPFVDLKPQHDELRAELDALFRQVLDTSSFIGGPLVEEFEAEFARYLGAPHVVGVSSGTDAVRIALQVAGVARDDLVVTVSHTFIGTTEGVTQLGAVPIFVDIDADSFTMSPVALEDFLDGQCRRDGDVLRHRRSGRRVAAIMPVHLYGQSADMEPILASAADYGVPVVEDAAQAQGATYRFANGRVARCGTMGVSAAFSFYPGKNLGAIGEAGAVATGDVELASRARMLRDHGQIEKYVHLVADGANARLDALQAGVLSLKLRRLDEWNARRRALALHYDEALDALDIQAPREMPWAEHVYHLYVVELPNRDEVRAALAEGGIATGLHYPVPLHRQPAFEGADIAGGPLEQTERAAERCLSLPMYPHLSAAQADRVVEALAAAVAVPLSA
ncbi:MAG TPA: DegT/DnrJ/EryC1/StrS family aminotransferase [Longimicrobiales bacterium]|nr:DegT/DnrJ/EryC1/StrS family aminotransferase [Longimicrobiales bacterium]